MFSRMCRFVGVWGVAIWLLTLPVSRQARGDVTPKERPSSALRVLVVSDGDDAGETSAAILRQVLTSTGRFDVRLCEVPVAVSARMLADFDLVVLDAPGLSSGRETESAIESFVASGKGLLITQRGLVRSSSSGTPEGQKLATGNERACWPAIASNGSCSPVRFVDVKFDRPEHAILKGLATEFRPADAIFRGLDLALGATILASAVDEANRGGSGKPEPVLVVSAAGKGRVVALGLGHDRSAMHEPEFRAILARSAEWAATGAVTLGTDIGALKPAAGAIKALLITGGHEHEVAFYELFNGYADLDWIPVLTSADAFKADLRHKYNVIIMYDFSRDLSDAGKQNLRAFVESGGGVVVLHHALLNYQNWDWWTKDTVGGSYRLSRTADAPSSRVKNDQQIYVTPATAHSITAGIEPFHIQDEAYKGMRMSAKIRPLLTTDHAASDRDLAWIGPDERFRVVAMQLGHGHTAFGHPTYRALVHNAILWAAGKTK
jgi:type 1 glutamine amidotransferase